MKSVALLICFLLHLVTILPPIGYSVTEGFPTHEARTENLTISPSFVTGDAVDQDGPVDLYLSRPLHDPESRVAILIGTTDVSSLFERSDLRLRYNANLWPLPLGQSAVTVYIVTKDDVWQSSGRL